MRIDLDKAALAMQAAEKLSREMEDLISLREQLRELENRVALSKKAGKTKRHH